MKRVEYGRRRRKQRVVIGGMVAKPGELGLEAGRLRDDFASRVEVMHESGQSREAYVIREPECAIAAPRTS